MARQVDETQVPDIVKAMIKASNRNTLLIYEPGQGEIEREFFREAYLEGKEIGLQLRFTHRTLQRLVICFAFGLIAGLSEQEYTDPRNGTAIQTAKKIAQMLEDGELPLGLYI